MPTVLKEKVKVVRSGRKPTHKYDEWFAQADEVTKNGGSLQLVQGQDFNCTAHTMRHNLYRASKAKGLSIKTATLTSDDGTESISINEIGPVAKASKAKAKK